MAKVQPVLEPGDQMILRAALGWLELQLPQEALAELGQLGEQKRQDPLALEVRWQILSQMGDWDQALAASHALMKAAPGNASTWLHHAYAQRRATGGSLESAYETLVQAAEKFSDEPTIFYNLACYVCQLRRPVTETVEWFKRALRVGEPKHLMQMALEDSDLAPVRQILRQLEE